MIAGTKPFLPVHSELDDSSTLLSVRMLGPPSVTWEGRPLPIPRRQVRALLYVLASATSPLSRDTVAALFWPDVPPDVGTTNLSRLLYFLQRALPDPTLLKREGNTLGLDEARAWADTRVIADVLARASPTRDMLRAAAGLYRGPFLDGFFLPGAPRFDLWLDQERHAWERRYLTLLTRLIEVEEHLGHYHEAILWAQRYLDIDELAEHIHRTLIRLYAAVGDRESAARQFEQCVIVLERELGVSPLPETRAVYEAAMRGRAVAVPPSPQPRWQVRPSLRAPFVGRDDALAAILQAYMRVRTGRGTLVFIAGEPGIGKTRLLQEFTATLPESTRVLIIAGSETEQDVPYAALQRGLGNLLPAVDLQSLHLSPSLLAVIARVVPDLRRLWPDLPPPESPPPGHDQYHFFRALDHLFDALARRYPPFILCVDDLHWLDVSTRTWLGHWLTHAHHLPVLVLITYRPDHVESILPLQQSAARRGAPVRLELTGLDIPSVARLVREVTGEDALDPAGVERLHAASGGNPFFLLEVLRVLVEQGSLSPEALATVPLPTSVEEAVRRRLGRLPPRERYVLEAAAVLGQRFVADILVETSGYDEEAVVAALESLTARGLITEDPPAYRFVHGLVRDLAYRSMTEGRRQLLHRRAARALLRREGDAATVARHLHLGGRPREAASWWVRAGDRARLVYAYEDAIHCYERALALQRDLKDEEGASRTLMRLGLTHHTAFRFVHAADAYRQGFDLWQRARPAVPVLPPAAHALRVDWPHLLTLDPALAEDPNSGGVIEHLFAGLAEWDPDMNVVPDVTRGWDVLADGSQYVFYLREDAMWSDGRPVRAQDFVLAWQRVLDPRRANPYARLLFPIRNARRFYDGDINDPAVLGVRALDDLTLLVELERPCSFFPHLVAHPVTRPVPTHLIEREGDRWWRPDTIVTNGPFLLKAWEGNRRVTLARFPMYRGRWPGNVEEVELHLGLDRDSKEGKWQRYLEDALDVFTLRWGLPPEILERVSREHAAERVSSPNFFVRFLGFNTRKPPFDRPEARRAFALAINRQTLASLIGGDLVPARGGLIPPHMPGHTPDIGPAYDPLAARSALVAAGYRGGHGFPEVVMLVFPAARPAAAYLKQAWERILHVSVRLEEVLWDEYVRRLTHGPVPDVFLAGWVADYPDPDSLLRVNTVLEWTGWHNDAYGALLERATLSRNQEERVHLYRQADAILIQDLPVVPLFYCCWTILLKRWVQAFPVCPLKWWFWKDVVLIRD